MYKIVLAEDHVLVRVVRADAGEAVFSLDGDEHVALVEVRVEVLGTVDVDGGDFHGLLTDLI